MPFWVPMRRRVGVLVYLEYEPSDLPRETEIRGMQELSHLRNHLPEGVRAGGARKCETSGRQKQEAVKG